MSTNNEKSYNGWSNYETWAVNLWMDNDEGSQSHWREEAEGCYENAEADSDFSKAERATLDLADRIKTEHEEMQPEVSGVFADLLNAAMGEVDWHEIAKALIESIIEEGAAK